MKLKKLIIYCLIAALLLLVACQPKDDASVTVRVATLKGPTGMGMAKLISDNAAATDPSYEITLASAPDEVTAALISKSVDIAALPVNLAAVLWNRTEGEIQIMAVNTLGVLYVLENGDTVHSVSDLAGKTLGATGQGSTPEYVLNYILKGNNIDPVTGINVEYLTEHSGLATLLASGESKLGMLPEPNVTAAMAGNSSLRVALDLTEEWEKLSDGVSLVQGVVVVRSEFAEAHPDEVAEFGRAYSESVEYINSNDGAPAMIAAAGIVANEAVAASALPRCNITYLTGNEMIAATDAMLKVLFDANPASVGGALPDESIYRSAD